MRLTGGILQTISGIVSDSNIWCVVRLMHGVKLAGLAPSFYIMLGGHIVSISLISVTLFNAIEILKAIGNTAKGVTY